jgi:heat shock protein HtpX
MPFTHVEIEQRKSRAIAGLFGVLAALYIGSLLALAWGVTFPRPLSGTATMAIVGLGLAVAAGHWTLSTPRLVERVLEAVGARAADSEDTYHARFIRVVEEVSVATGGRFRIGPYVIQTTAMNACAASEPGGRAAIAVTEGLLARLNRSQLESVVGHEAAHIVSGDSLATTICCGLFALHEEALKRFSGWFHEGGVHVSGRMALIIPVVMVVLMVTRGIKRLCALAISRQQEYRADAVAVKLTRNPLSLAEALHLLSIHWRGVGAFGESLSTIFIVEPGADALSEQEGTFADLFSTHPPTSRRIDALLGMAHLSPEAFEQMVKAPGWPPRLRKTLPPEHPMPPATTGSWFVWLDGMWQGPWTAEQLREDARLTPESWVRRDGDTTVRLATQEPALLAILQRRYGTVSKDGKMCPNCRMSLERTSYEGVPLDTCPACHGCYVIPNQLKRMFARQEYEFPESVKRLAETMMAMQRTPRIMNWRQREGGQRMGWGLLADRRCPACRSGVVRKFYTVVLLVEVEQCVMCGLTWLDHQELELLQCLHERNTELFGP